LKERNDVLTDDIELKLKNHGRMKNDGRKGTTNDEMEVVGLVGRLGFFGPFVFSTNSFLFFWGEIVGDVEGLSDLFWCLAFDH
jgi:hypothetical protein